MSGTQGPSLHISGPKFPSLPPPPLSGSLPQPGSSETPVFSKHIGWWDPLNIPPEPRGGGEAPMIWEKSEALVSTWGVGGGALLSHNA